MKKTAIAAALLFLSLTGCGTATYDDFVFPETDKSTLEPVGDIFNYNDYSSIPPTKEETNETFVSDDGLCIIGKKEHYFDVSLDLTSGDHYNAGRSYAETVLKADPGFEKKADAFLSDLIIASMTDVKKTQRSSVLHSKITSILHTLPEEYRDELEGFGSVFGNTKDIAPNDGVLSEYEALLLQLAPDLLTDSVGYAVSVGGERTQSHKQLSAVVSVSYGRNGDYLSEDHCVLRMKNPDSTITSLTSLGIMNVNTAVNDKGVLVSLMNSYYDQGNDRTDTGVSCTFTLRNAIENCDNAENTAKQIISEADKFNKSYSVFLTDSTHSYSAELCCDEDNRKYILRDKDTKLLDGLGNNFSDCLVAVNQLTAYGMPDMITRKNNTLNSEYFKWIKSEEIFGGNDLIDQSRLKEILTYEKHGTPITRIRNDDMIFMLIADHESRTLQADLVGNEGVQDTPEFIDLGTF